MRKNQTQGPPPERSKDPPDDVPKGPPDDVPKGPPDGVPNPGPKKPKPGRPFGGTDMSTEPTATQAR